jgi:lipopolysaccharide/colanic/teichoic acid biosynthesis glycosyltransferase
VTALAVADAPARPAALDECPWLARYPVRTTRSRAHEVAKRVVDVGVSALVLLAALPVLLVALLALKCASPAAPAFYVQARTGYRGRAFRLFKLRTMVPDADARKQELARQNLRQWPDFKVEHDPRVTRIGRVLRATSVDELPQLLNVLRGDMSLVGPRPTTIRPELYEPWQHERFAVRPGLTGLWQISARESSSFDHRLRLDIAYATRRCLRLDLAILLRTVPVVLLGRGAV